MGCFFNVVHLPTCWYEYIWLHLKRHLSYANWNFLKFLSNIARNPCDSIKLRVGRLGMPWLEHDFKLATWTKLNSVSNNLWRQNLHFSNHSKIVCWKWFQWMWREQDKIYDSPQLIVISLISNRARWEVRSVGEHQVQLFRTKEHV